jgi:hypothetical protein
MDEEHLKNHHLALKIIKKDFNFTEEEEDINEHDDK